MTLPTKRRVRLRIRGFAAFSALVAIIVASVAVAVSPDGAGDRTNPPPTAPTTLPAAHDVSAIAYATSIRPLLTRYCLDCHSTKKHKGGLDIERFQTLDHVRRDV